MKPSRLRQSAFLQNIAALYSVHIFNYLLPLITVPFLARVLKPEGWGMVAFAQSFGQFLVLVIEYGFGLSATREVAARRDDREFLAGILGSVLLAKLLLSIPAIAAGVLANRFVPALRNNVFLLWAAISWAVSQGMSLVWFYQGLERLRFASTAEIIAKTLAVIFILSFIRRPDQAWLVLVFFALTSAASTVVVLVAALRRYGVRRPKLSDALQALRVGFPMFVFRSSVSLYTTGNAFLLGLFVDPSAVGVYAGAERISRSFLGLMNPVSQALYPRINNLVAKSRREAAALARKAMLIVVSLACLIAFTLVILAPLIVNVILGPNFEGSVLILRLLATLLPLIAGSNVLGIQWMLPLRRDRAFNSIIAAAGLMNLILAYLLAPHLQGPGMALAVVGSEVFVTISCFVYLQTRSLSPFSRYFIPHYKIPA